MGYEGMYQVSTFGNVKSLKYNKERLLKQGIKKAGYHIVVLSKKGKLKQFTVHRLVAEAFFNMIPKNLVVDHIDGNKSNNHLYNLQLITQTENVRKTWVGKTHSKETKIKISEANKGKIPWNKGKKKGLASANPFE